MSAIDVTILTLTILLLLSIIFFNLVFPKIKGNNSKCLSCPAVKKAKRLYKNYSKENKK